MTLELNNEMFKRPDSKEDWQFIESLLKTHISNKRILCVVLERMKFPTSEIYLINKNEGVLGVYDTNEYLMFLSETSRGKGLSSKAFDFIKKNIPRSYYFGTIRLGNESSLASAIKNGFKIKGLVVAYEMC